MDASAVLPAYKRLWGHFYIDCLIKMKQSGICPNWSMPTIIVKADCNKKVTCRKPQHCNETTTDDLTAAISATAGGTKNIIRPIGMSVENQEPCTTSIFWVSNHLILYHICSAPIWIRNVKSTTKDIRKETHSHDASEATKNEELLLQTWVTPSVNSLNTHYIVTKKL